MSIVSGRTSTGATMGTADIVDENMRRNSYKVLRQTQLCVYNMTERRYVMDITLKWRGSDGTNILDTGWFLLPLDKKDGIPYLTDMVSIQYAIRQTNSGVSIRFANRLTSYRLSEDFKGSLEEARNLCEEHLQTIMEELCWQIKQALLNRRSDE